MLSPRKARSRVPNQRQHQFLTRRLDESFASYMDKESSIMTSALLDESLDVRKRLIQLQEWQTEWYRIDRHLENQVSRLDGNKLMELQQASHIANVRRRMEMTLVKTPLSIPGRVLLDL